VAAAPGRARLITFSQPRCHRGGNRQPEQGLSAEEITGRSPPPRRPTRSARPRRPSA